MVHGRVWFTANGRKQAKGDNVSSAFAVEPPDKT